MYKTILTMSGKEYEGRGKTLTDALNDIPLTYLQIKTKGVLKVSKGKKTAEKLFYLLPLRRLFASKMSKILWAKNLELLLR